MSPRQGSAMVKMKDQSSMISALEAKPMVMKYCRPYGAVPMNHSKCKGKMMQTGDIFLYHCTCDCHSIVAPWSR